MSLASIKRNINFSVLNEDKINSIHEASLNLIEKTGMQVDGERTLQLLKKNGAKILDNNIVKIPREVVEWALKKAPKEMVLYTRDGEPYLEINSQNQVYFGTHADMLDFVDPFSGEVRKFMKKDTEVMCKIADYLKNISFVLSVGMSNDVSPKIQSQVTFMETAKNFRKPINFSTNDVDSLHDIIEIASNVTGGLKNLQEKPFIFNYCEPIPPLNHPVESTEKLYICAENKIPTVYMPYCMMGGTSPMSFAATLAQCNAEALTGLVITQLVNEGTPFIYGAMPSIFDMRTTIGSYGAPEFHLLIAAASEIVAHYGIPFFGTAGCTDAKVIDEQAVSETTMEIFSTLMSKANLIHDVGVMDHCNSVSPELVVLADEIIEGLGHYAGGIEVNEEELALDVINKVGHAGHYLNEAHTIQNFKKIWYPNFFSREMENKDESQVRIKIKEKINDIICNHQVPALDNKITAELEKWDNKLNNSVA
jgi:trimethylamine--corrinoid protein Co-methyltransferase